MSVSSWKDVFSEALSIEGALGFALGDWRSGACLAFRGTNALAFPERDLSLVIIGNSEVIRTQLKVAQSLKLKLEEILIVVGTQYYLIRLTNFRGLFLYLVLDGEKGNLAVARIKLGQIAEQVSELSAQKLKN